MKFILSKLEHEGTTVGYRVANGSRKYDLSVGDAKYLIGVTGKGYFKKGASIPVVKNGDMYCSSDESGVEERVDWFELSRELTHSTLDKGYITKDSKYDFDGLSEYLNLNGVRKSISEIKKEMLNVRGIVYTYLNIGEYDSNIKVDRHFCRFTDYVKFIVNYVNVNWEELSASKTNLELRVKLNSETRRVKVSKNIDVETCICDIAKYISHRVTEYSDIILEAVGDNELSMSLYGEDERGWRLLIEAVCDEDLVATDFKSCDVPGYLSE